MVSVWADTRPLVKTVAQDAQKAGTAAGQAIAKHTTGEVEKSSGKFGKVFGSIGRTAATGLGLAAIAATGFGVESFKAAARTAEMDDALKALAATNKASYPAMQATVDAVRRQGVSAGSAQQLVATLTRNHIGLANATKLTAIAQNAGIITGRGTSATLDSINKAIITQNPRMLKTAGLQVNVNKAIADYAKQLHTTSAALTTQQRSQAITNAVLAAGGTVAGAYAKAMNDPARVLRSLPLILDNIKESVGTGLVQAFGPAVVGFGRFARTLSSALAPGGKLAPILTAVGKAAAQMAAPLTAVFAKLSTWINQLKPGQVQGFANAIVKLAPEIAGIGAALATFAGGRLGGNIPVIGELLKGLGGPIGIVVSGLATLALTSPAARGALTQLIGVLGGVVSTLMKALGPLVAQLAQALGPLLAAAIKALLPLVSALVPVLFATLQVVTPLVPLITWLAQILAKLAPIIVPVVAAWWLLNAAVSAFPGSWIVLIIAAVVVGLRLLWTHSQTFRTIVEGAMHGVAVAFHAVAAAFDWLGQHWRLVLQILLAVTTGGFGLIALVIFNNWTRIRNFVTGAAQAVYNTVLRWWSATANFVTGNLSALWANVVRVWSAVRNFVAGAAQAVWSTVSRWFNAATSAIGTALATAWAAIGSWFGRLPSYITSFASMEARGFATVGGQMISGLMNGISGAMRGIGGWLKRVVIDPIVNGVKGFFGIHSPSTVMAGIGGNLVAGLFKGLAHDAGGMVKMVFGGWPAALGGLISKGFTALTALPGKALSAIGSVAGKVGGFLGHLFGGGGGSGVDRWRPLMLSVLQMFGLPNLLGVFMAQMQTESGGNQFAQNNWDINAKNGVPSKGLLQVIQPTFDAFAGPFRNRGIFDPLANLYSAVAYAVSRYGANISNVLGHGHGYATGGIIREPVFGFGVRSMAPYVLGEAGDERVSPLRGGYTAAERHIMGELSAQRSRAGNVINVYPRAHQSETQIAAAVNSALAWAAAGGQA
jgi:SLT domain-containing protein